MESFRPLAIVGNTQARLQDWVRTQPLLPSPIVLLSRPDQARGCRLSGAIFLDPPSEEMVQALEPCLYG